MSRLGGGPGRSTVTLADGSTVVVSGLFTAMVVTTKDVTDVASALPLVALADRNSITISNLSTTETLFISSSASVAANRVNGTTAGHEIGPLESFNINITDAIVLFGIAETGKTIKIKVMEVA
jgi:hypothetical protein